MSNKIKGESMFMRELKGLFLIILGFITIGVIVSGCDNSTDPDNPGGGTTKVAAPKDLALEINANAGGSSFAILSWNSSTDETNSNFSGYVISTYSVNSDGSIISIFQKEKVSKNTHVFNILGVNRATRYKSYVAAILSDSTRSDSIATKIYGGVYYNNNGSIDEYTSSGSAESGYGWDPVTGAGNQYAYNEANASKIDLHLRSDGGQLKFFSPNIQSPGTKTTLMRLIGTGSDAFDKTDLEEPNLTSINVSDDQVYLLKTAEGYYVKVWITSINSVTALPPYSNVRFEYKVQPIVNLRVLKR